MAKKRLSPEQLLQRVQEEERQTQRGKLKIYLGAAPGVGKTYAMLRDAIAQRAQGLDVVIGVVESHGRQEIDSLLKDLEILPRQVVSYRDRQLTEFDLDGALKRSPGLILIDEMAHTNAPGLRHNKRWQDIKEILDRGIDVYTTLNVQHIESFNDVISQIIALPIKETVPDSMVELADTVALVDLPPEDLLKRLQEGKVYFPEQAELAKENFFRKGNLIALREIALRVTAELVNVQVLLYRYGQGIKNVWPTREKILVCIGAGTEAVKLIRATRRMAMGLQVDWIALHVDAPTLNLSEEERNRVMQNLRFAEQLGAETRIVPGLDIVKEILDFAREQNITRIIIGKKIRSRWHDLLFKNLTDEMVRNSNEIDVYIITGSAIKAKELKSVAPKKATPWNIYGVSLGIVGLATIINFLLFPYLHASNLIMVYLLGVMVVALFGRTGPSILASILSVFAYGLFFIPPEFGSAISQFQYIFTLLVMLLVTQVISHLTILAQRQATLARLAERRTAALHALSRQLASSRGVDKLLETAVRYIGEIFDSAVFALLPEDNRLVVRTKYGSDEMLNEKEHSVAQWVYDLRQVAGLGTDTLSSSDSLYVPLLTPEGSIGVLRVRPEKSKQLFSPEQMNLLQACVNQVALALEADLLEEQAKRSEL